MERIEGELSRLFARQTPASDFRDRTMERVRQQPRPGRRPVWHWAAIGAVAASLTVGIYVEKQRRDRRTEVNAQHAEMILESLSLAGAKINQARDAVLRPGPGE